MKTIDEYCEDCKTTLKHTSLDDNNKCYMVEHEIQVIDFDLLKENYCTDMSDISGAKSAATSADALIFRGDKVYFIEFKNGNIQPSHQKSKIKSKLRDSVLIYCDIIKEDLDFARKNVEFILVYNSTKNSLGVIQDKIFSLANSTFCHFGLEVLKGIFAFDVKTYNVEEFAEYFLKNLNILE